MKIAKLVTWQWGSLESREWPFADTVLLTDESGSGKSTLLDAYFSPSWTAFQVDGGRDFNVVVDGVSV